MFFFKKKKLIEIDQKIDSVLEQLRVSIQKYEEMISFISKIENRMDLIEDRIDRTNSSISQSVKGTEFSVVNEINCLSEHIKKIENAMGALSEKNVADIISKMQSIIEVINLVKDDISVTQKESIVALRGTIGKSCAQLEQLITEDGTVCQDKIESTARELDDKLDMMDSSLRLLLLNSVMEQIEE